MKATRRKIGWILLFFLGVNTAFSQDSYIANKSFATDFGMARVIRGYSHLPEIENSWFLSSSYGVQTRGEKAWQRYLNYPEYGLSSMYVTHQNECLGQSLGIAPYVRFYLSPLEAAFKFSISGGLGFAYFTNPYHPYDNPENALIGSSVTNYTRGDIEISYQYRHLSMQLSAGAFHYSTGHVKLPNIGMNMLVFQGVLAYRPETERNIKENQTIQEKSNFKKSLRIGLGVHSFGSSVKPWGGPVYPVYSLSAACDFTKNNVVFIGGGSNVTYYTSFANFLMDNELEMGSEFQKSLVWNLFFSQEVVLGHVGIYFEEGLDILKPFYRDYYKLYNDGSGLDHFMKSYNSNKLGLKFYLHPLEEMEETNLVIGLYIKTNYAQADFSELGIAYVF